MGCPRPPLTRYEVSPDGRRIGSQAELYEPHAVNKIRRRLVEVVLCEGPISITLAARRVATSWGFARVGNRAIERITGLIPEREIHVQRNEAGTFLWPIEMRPVDYEAFRVPLPDGRGQRDAEDLPVEEVANAMLHLLSNHGGTPQAELIRETGRLFGFQRTGRVVQERMLLGLHLLEGRDRVERRGEQIVAVSS